MKKCLFFKGVRLTGSQLNIILPKDSYSGMAKGATLLYNEIKQKNRKVNLIQYQNLNEIEKNSLNIIHANPPALPKIILKIGIYKFLNCENYGYWAWEVSDLPFRYKIAAKLFKKIIVPTEYVKTVFNDNGLNNVKVYPHKIQFDQNFGTNTKESIDENRLLKIGTIFNFGSDIERKNPFILVEALRNFAGIQVFIKTHNGKRNPEQYSKLQNLISDTDSFHLIDEDWSSQQINDFIRSCDLFVSTHRAEGFGLTIAQSILLYTPVMVTNWSGNAEFINPDYSYALDYELVKPDIINNRNLEGLNFLWADVQVDEIKRKFSKFLIDFEKNRLTKMNILAYEYLLSYLNKYNLESILED